MNEINPSDYPKKDISLHTTTPLYKTLPGIVLIETILFSFLAVGFACITENYWTTTSEIDFLIKILAGSFPLIIIGSVIIWIILDDKKQKKELQK